MPGLHDDRGSATLELVVWAPVLLLISSVIVFAGRTAQATQTVEVAAAEAARAASAAGTEHQARLAARDAADAALGSVGLHCLDTAVDIDTSQWRRPPGTPARVQTTIHCRLGLGDLVMPGVVGGSRTVTGSGSSALDSFRVRP